MKDIIVTTPISEMANAVKEAERCKAEGGDTHYFRCLNTFPKDFGLGSKVFYVEDGFVRGFAEIDKIDLSGFPTLTCSTTQKIRGGKYVVFMKASSWKWIAPIPMKGFQGWRYYNSYPYTVVGDWLAERP